MSQARLLLVLAVLGLASAGGCGRPAPVPGTVELEFWTQSLHPAYDGYIQGLIARFEEAHPGVTVHWLDLPQKATSQKLMASVAGGVSPDVVNLTTDMALNLAQNQALVDLEEALPKEVQASYFPGLWEAARYQDGVYAAPWYVTTRVLMYNREIFEQAGLDPQEPPRTFEDLAAAARQVHARTSAYGTMPPIRMLEDWGMFGIPLLEGGRAVFDGPAAVARLQWYVDLYRDGTLPRETLTEGYSGAIDRYKAGSLAILEAGPQFLLKVKSDAPEVYRVTGVAAYPESPTGTIPAATMSLAVPRPSRHRALALEFVQFVTRPDCELEFCRLAPILPTVRSAAQDPFFLQGQGQDPLIDEAVRVSIRQLARARDFSPGLPHQQDLNKALKEAVESAMYGRRSPEQALSQAAARWNEVLQAP